MDLTLTLSHYVRMILAWLTSMIPAAAALVVVLLILGLVGIFFYAMGILHLFRHAVDLYLEQHDPTFTQRRNRRGV